MGFRRRCAAWRVTFLCVAKEKSPKERPPPLVRPPASGSLGSGKRLAERHRRYIPVPPASAPSSMTALLTLCPHLGKQQGATPNPQHRGQLTSVGCNKRSALHRANTSLPIRGIDRACCYLTANPSPPYGEIRLPPLCNRYHRHGCVSEKSL